MSGEIDGAAEEFERTADWLRNELKSLVALLRAAEPEADEEIQERRTTRGAQGRQLRIRMPGIELPGPHHEGTPGEAIAAADGAMTAAGWHTRIGEGAWGPYLAATQSGFEASLSSRGAGRLDAWGEAPIVWFNSTWTRPPRAATSLTVTPGYEVCRWCDGWGTCSTCEGLGFWEGRTCPDCGLGMDRWKCRGTGRLLVDG
ncbi:hypothetical protein [Streptomyces sp. NPDC086838]|uniref:hypothetical protein n=1 Tax=Streptomyces sp. NPDC086838 TaxID=3365762 RepID=UPI0038184345